MVWLIASIISSSMIGLVLRLNEQQGHSRIGAMFFNYVCVVVLNTGYWVYQGCPMIPPGCVVLGVMMGVGFLFGLRCFFSATGLGGVALATTFARISLVLPLVVSIFLFHEHPNQWQVVGICLALVAMMMFSKARIQRGRSIHTIKPVAWLWLVLLFIVFGLNATFFKLFDAYYPDESKTAFIGVLFGVALIGSGVWLVVGKHAMDQGSMINGVLLGIPNWVSPFFFLMALREMGGVTTFPANDVGVILFSTLVAIPLFKERPSRLGWAALAVASVAIALLNLGGV